MITKQPNEEPAKGFSSETESESSLAGPPVGGEARPSADGGNRDRKPASEGVSRPPEDLATGGNGGGTLLATAERADMRIRWSDIQESFVDNPKSAVEEADQLVGEAIQRLSEIFQDTRRNLEEGWGSESVSTEQLRQALQRYRTFFDQILAV
jgi:hypothetical protein